MTLSQRTAPPTVRGTSASCVECGKCFIEYIPAENAWIPILAAEGYMYIDCLWVSGALKGHGYANDLLDACVNDSKNKGKIGQTLQAINIVSLLLFGFISIILCYYCFTRTMHEEISQELRYVACSVETLLDTAYPGDYSLVG